MPIIELTLLATYLQTLTRIEPNGHWNFGQSQAKGL